MNSNEELIAEARKAAKTVYLAAPEPVARDLSMILTGLADAFEEAERKIAAGLEYLTMIREDHAPHILIVRHGAIAALSTPPQQKDVVGECEAFAWIGQPFSYCDDCAKPYWEHSHRRGVFDEAGTLVPITADEAAATKDKWGKR